MSGLLKKKNLYTVVLEYKTNTYIYQVFANNEIEAQVKWVKCMDLNIINVCNAKKKEELILNASDESDCPGLLNGAQDVWCSSISSLSNDEHDYATANIIKTIKNKQQSKDDHSKTVEKIEEAVFSFSKRKILFTVQLDYKGGMYVSQVLANDPVDAKIKWIKQLNLSEIDKAPNTPETKDNLLADTKNQDFNPTPLDGMDSVWSTSAQLGDEIGRVTIVATQSNVVNL
jgi:hypothetical protein